MRFKGIVCTAAAVLLTMNSFAFAAVQSGRKNTAVTESSIQINTQKEIKNIKAKRGQNFSIVLEQNASTGYSWSYKINTKSIRLVSQKTINKKHPGGMVGYPTQGMWTFKGSKKGDYKITFSYSRSWEKNVPPAKVVEYNIKVK